MDKDESPQHVEKEKAPHSCQKGTPTLSPHQKSQLNTSSSNQFSPDPEHFPHSPQKIFPHSESAAVQHISLECSTFWQEPWCVHRPIPSLHFLAVSHREIQHPLVLMKTKGHTKPRKMSGKAQNSKAINKRNWISSSFPKDHTIRIKTTTTT